MVAVERGFSPLYTASRTLPLVLLLLSWLALAAEAFAFPPPSRPGGSSSALKDCSARSGSRLSWTMSSEEAPSLRFVTNKMCPYAQKTWIALEESRLPYQMQEISLYGPGGKPDWFMKLNNKGEIPVLVDERKKEEDVVIVGSEATLDHIGSLCGSDSALQPPSGGDVANRCAEWRRMVDTQLKPAGKMSVLADARSELDALLKRLDGEVDASGPFLCGKDFTLADASAYPFFQRIRHEYGGFPKGCDRLERWLKACEERPSIRKTKQTNWWWWW